MSANNKTYTLYIECSDEVKNMYENDVLHTGENLGFDLRVPKDTRIFKREYSRRVPLGIRCAMVKTVYTRMESIDGQGLRTVYVKPCSTTVPFDLSLRSSTAAKTPLRLANNVGKIDKGYRGELAAIFDNLGDYEYDIKQGDRLVQVHLPSSKSFDVKFIDGNISDMFPSERGEGGFGSTGCN